MTKRKINLNDYRAKAVPPSKYQSNLWAWVALFFIALLIMALLN